MSRRRRKPRRREQGHPARIAARRERDHAGSRETSPIAAICASAARIESALEAELHASELLGMPWRDSDFGDPDEYEVEIGGELADELAAHGGVGALVLLEGIAALAGSTLAEKASRLADRLRPDLNLPDWVEAIGTARPERTAVASEATFDDGRTWFIESVNSLGERDTVGVYIDHNLGCSAKDILMATSIAEIKEIHDRNPIAGAAITVKDVDPGLAAARIRAAMELTDSTLSPITAEEYASYRALARNRVASLPDAEPDAGRPEVTEAEREALLDEFLASPEARAGKFEPEGDAASVVANAITFTADYVDGRPLRWSPVTVEIFMASWLPYKVVAEEDYFDSVPDALEAWIRFTGRKRELPVEAVDQVLAAVKEFAPVLAEEIANPSGGGSPGQELLTAMREAGIDPTDEEALQTFIAGWNARSLLD